MIRNNFKYCLNTATIRDKKLSLKDTLEVASKAGYHAVEPWIDELDAAIAGGETPGSIRRMFSDYGLSLQGAIGFFEWAVDDKERRSAGFLEARRNMELLSGIGGSHLAAPPFGATTCDPLDLNIVAERYRKLLELGDEYGVSPLLEVWGFSRNISKLEEALYVAARANHQRACILADVYHLYKGGSGFEGLRLLHPSALPIFHVNDYPSSPGRETIVDAQRVYPGDGVAPLSEIFSILYNNGFDGYLSLELFNAEYYKMEALDNAATGLQKLKRIDEVPGS